MRVAVLLGVVACAATVEKHPAEKVPHARPGCVVARSRADVDAYYAPNPEGVTTCSFHPLEGELGVSASRYVCAGDNGCTHRDCYRAWSQQFVAVDGELFPVGDGRLTTWSSAGRHFLVEAYLRGPDHERLTEGASRVIVRELVEGQLCERGVRHGKGDGFGSAQIAVRWMGEGRVRYDVLPDSASLVAGDRGCREETLALEEDDLVTALESDCICAQPQHAEREPVCNDPSSRRWRRLYRWSDAGRDDGFELRECERSRGEPWRELWITRASGETLVYPSWPHLEVAVVEGHVAVRVNELRGLVWDHGLDAACPLPWPRPTEGRTRLRPRAGRE